jgi:hypothetical protein
VTVEILYRKNLFMWRCSPTRAMASSFMMFSRSHTWHATVGRTPLDEWSVRHRDLYLTTHNTHGGIQTHDRSRRAAVDLHLRLRGHWDWLFLFIHKWMFNSWTKFFLWHVCDLPSNIQGAEVVLFTNYSNMLAAKKKNKCTLKHELQKILEKLQFWFHTNNPVIKRTW